MAMKMKTKRRETEHTMRDGDGTDGGGQRGEEGKRREESEARRSRSCNSPPVDHDHHLPPPDRHHPRHQLSWLLDLSMRPTFTCTALWLGDQLLLSHRLTDI